MPPYGAPNTPYVSSGTNTGVGSLPGASPQDVQALNAIKSGFLGGSDAGGTPAYVPWLTTSPTQTTDPSLPQTQGTQDPAANAAAQAAAQQRALIDQQLGRLGNQQSIGNQNILDQYNRAFQQLTNNQGQAQRNYDTAVNQSQTDNQTAKANIDQGVRAQLSGLQRLLGVRGAGFSSAAQTLAPYAAGREGNIQRGQVQNAYGRNMSALDTNWGDTQNQFTNAFGDLGAQKQNQQNALQASIDQSRAGLLAQQANPDTGQINALQNQIDQLGRQVVFQPQAVNYQTPDLAKYNYSTFGPASAGSGLEQSISPYQYLLNGQQQQKNLAGQSLIGATA